MRRPQVYMSSRAALETGLLTRPRIARASTSERTSGSRRRLGGRTLFLRIETNCGPGYGYKGTGCRRGGVRRFRARRRAHRADAADSCAPRLRSADQVSADSMQQGRELLARRPPWSRPTNRQRSCPQSCSHATQSSRSSSVRATRDIRPGPRRDILDRLTARDLILIARGLLQLRRSRSVQRSLCRPPKYAEWVREDLDFSTRLRAVSSVPFGIAALTALQGMRAGDRSAGNAFACCVCTA